jgi:uncharacterized protein (TIGR03437 family)
MGRFVRSRLHAVVLYSLAGFYPAYCQQPAWYNQPQFFAVFDFQSVNGSLVSFTGQGSNVPYTGQSWGIQYSVYPVNSGDYPAQDVAAWKARDQNGPYFASISLDTIYLNQGSSPNPAWDAFRMRTLSGQYLDQFDTRKGTFADYSLSSPVFQAFLIASAQQAVDAGADGLLVDDVQSQLGAIQYGSAQAGSFDAITMGAFQTYLQQKYSASVLATQFGIADITTFNFGSYIQAKGLSTAWNQEPLTGLSDEFFVFKRQESLNFLRNLISTTKQYAQQKYALNFLFTCNDTDNTAGYFVTDVMDLTTPELFYIQGDTHPFHAIDVKDWTGWKAPTLPLAETAPSSLSGVTMPLAAPTVNLERVIIADIQAAGGMAGASLQMNVGVRVPEPVDLSVVNRYANFILGNPQIMSQTKAPARVGLLHSAPSVLGGVLSTPGENSPWNGFTNYTGMARLLLDSGFTYDAVFLPDTSYSQLPPLQPADLAKYSVVIAPSAFSLDSNQVAALLAYAQAGGTLIVDGHFATNEPSGAAASYPELNSILAAPGQTAYGAGQIVFSKELFGVEYQATSGGTLVGVDNAAQRQARASFQAFMTPYIQPDVQVVQPPAQIYEPGITPFMYHDRSGNTLVHLVNYDYDLATDSFYTKTNIQVSVQVGSQAVSDVIVRSPDFTGAQSLPFTRSGGTITVTVPEVDAWVVLYFQQNALAPVISSVSPATTFGAVGGSSLSFSVNASDPDGNPLTYTWSVNGTVVTNVFGPAYALQLPLTANGIYTVTVVVTDGSRVTETSWTVNVAAYRAPRFLFDETHDEQNTLSPARAQQISPQNSTYVLYSILEQALSPGYQVTDLLNGTAGSLTQQALSGTDVLVLAAPETPLTAAENQAVTNFVQSGGGLIFLGQAGISTSINALIGPWGIQFNNTEIESPQDINGFPGIFNLSTFANNPAVGLNPSFQVNYSGSLTVSQGGVALGQTSAAEWKSVSGAATQQPGDPNGPFVIVGAAQFGSGRVFAVSDNFFDDSVLQYPSGAGNLNLFLSGLAWVTSSVNPTPVAPPAGTAIVKSVANGGSFAPAISPGSWATVFGSNLANTSPTGQSWSASDFQGNLLPTSLDGTSVLINGRSAAVYFISPGQLNVQAPDDTTQGTVAVQVVSPFGIAQGTATLASIAPSIFPVAFDGVVYAAAVAIDGTLLAAPGQIPGSRAANPGETVEIFGTGFGGTVPPQPAGRLISVSPLANAVTASICGKSATVAYAGLVEVGLNQFNVVIPDSASGNCSVLFRVAGQSTQSGIVLPVAN